MFSSRAPKLIGAALMDLAEAMLRPVDDDGLERADRASDLSDPVAHARPNRRRASTAVSQPRLRVGAAGDDWFSEFPLPAARTAPHGAGDIVGHTAEHAHRRDVRLERRRRPGAVGRPPQPCSSPLPPKSAAAARSAS